MKIVAFHIQNFKSIKDTKIFLDQSLSVLTGENNCGKTTVIEALALWVECFEKLLHQAKRKVVGKYAAGDYVFGSSANRYFDFSEINSVRSPNFEDIFNDMDVKTPIRLAARLKNRSGEELRIPFIISNSTKSRYVISLEDEATFDYAKFNVFFKKFPNPVKSYFSAPLANIEQSENFVTDPVMQDGLRKRRSFEIIRNRIYKLYHTGSFFSLFQRDLSYILYGPTISATLKFFSRTDVLHDTRVVINYTIGQDMVEKDIALLGSGSLQAIEILLDLYNQVNGEHDLNLILLDEPDSHIHRDIQKRLYEILTRFHQENQIVITTHNESMIRTVALNSLFHVDITQRVLRSIGSNELEKLNMPHFTGLYPAQESPLIRRINGDATGLDLISAVEADKLFFVEGDDDARLLYCLYRKNPKNHNKKVMFWVLGGVSKIMSKIEGYHDVFCAIRNGVSLWEKSSLIFDQDCMMDEHIALLKEKLDSKFKIKAYAANIYTQESVLLTDLRILAALLCRRYGLKEEDVAHLEVALQEVCCKFLPSLREFDTECNQDKFTRQYKGQYIEKLNDLFGACIKGDILSLSHEIVSYFDKQSICKLAKKGDVERIINEAGLMVGHDFKFNIECDFYELAKKASDGFIFEIWKEIIAFMSE